MAVGEGSGDERAKIAAEHAINSRLLDITIDGAKGILFNVTGGPDLSLFEVNQAASIVRETAHPDANVIFGAVIDENMGDRIRITVIATGFDQHTKRQSFAPPQSAYAPPARPSAPSRDAAPDPAPRPTREQSRPDPKLSTDNLDIPAFLRRRS